MYFSEHIFFSPLYGSWPRYCTTTDQIRTRGIIDAFHIFRMFKFARIFDKNFEHDAHGVEESGKPNTFRGFCSRFPEIYVFM